MRFASRDLPAGKAILESIFGLNLFTTQEVVLTFRILTSVRGCNAIQS